MQSLETATREERTGIQDRETWSGVELSKAPLGQEWQRAGRQRIAFYHRSDRQT